MKLKSVLLLAVAMSCGLVAMLGVQQVLSSTRGEGIEKSRVLVAIAEITPGIPLTEENVSFKEMPAEAIPQGAVTQTEQYEDSVLKVRAFPGEVIMQAKLGKGIGVTADIPKGMRVATVAVDPTMTHSGLLIPGNHVDVLVTFKARAPQQGMAPSLKTKTVLEYVQVFATGSLRDAAGAVESGDEKAKNISLLVTPEEATILKLAESKGELYLTLRAEESDAFRGIVQGVDTWLYDDTPVPDGEEESEFATTNDDLENFLNDKPARVTATAVTADGPEIDPNAPKWTVEIFHGETRSKHEFILSSDLVLAEASPILPGRKPKAFRGLTGLWACSRDRA